MSKLLYLLRQPVEQTSAGLLDLSEATADVVLLEEAVFHPPLPPKGITVHAVGHGNVSWAQNLTYEELVEKVFSAEHVVVI